MQYRTGIAKPSIRHPLILIGLILILLILAVLLFQYSGKLHIFTKKVQPVASGSSGSSKGEPRSTQSNTPASPNSSAASNTSSSKFKGTLLAPSGDFVSSHHVNRGTLISSVCNTTSGATCKITFKNGGTIKSLTEEMSDANGSVYWNVWTPEGIGLYSGSWQVEAIATGGQQTKSSIDALPLEVSP